jgi:aerobic carbon-monoxide dehydrogenase large subunit
MTSPENHSSEAVSGIGRHSDQYHSRVLGTSPRRKEDRRLVTGQGRFVGDLELARMRQVAFVRSPVAHALITSVETAAAL